MSDDWLPYHKKNIAPHSTSLYPYQLIVTSNTLNFRVMCKNGGMAPCILRFEITWRWLFIFTTHLLYSHGTNTPVHIGHQNKIKRCGEIKISCSYHISKPGSSAIQLPRLVTVINNPTMQGNTPVQTCPTQTEPNVKISVLIRHFRHHSHCPRRLVMSSER